MVTHDKLALPHTTDELALPYTADTTVTSPHTYASVPAPVSDPHSKNRNHASCQFFSSVPGAGDPRSISVAACPAESNAER